MLLQIQDGTTQTLWTVMLALPFSIAEIFLPFCL